MYSSRAAARAADCGTGGRIAILLLAIDIGNTSIAVGVYDGPRLAARFRLGADPDLSAGEYGALLGDLLRGRGIDPSEVGAAALSSTVPALEATLAAVCRESFGAEPLVVAAGANTGIAVRYDDPREVGPDRVLHAVAALARHEPPLIIVDLGTALVFDAISREGEYLGGAIAPGVGIASRALFERAALLRRVSLEPPRAGSAIGRNTEHSLQSGICYGYAEMICGMVRRFQAELGGGATVIATGGYAGAIADAAGCIDAVEDDLNLEGLRLVHEANR